MRSVEIGLRDLHLYRGIAGPNPVGPTAIAARLTDLIVTIVCRICTGCLLVHAIRCMEPLWEHCPRKRFRSLRRPRNLYSAAPTSGKRAIDSVAGCHDGLSGRGAG